MQFKRRWGEKGFERTKTVQSLLQFLLPRANQPFFWHRSNPPLSLSSYLWRTDRPPERTSPNLISISKPRNEPIYVSWQYSSPDLNCQMLGREVAQSNPDQPNTFRPLKKSHSLMLTPSRLSLSKYTIYKRVATKREWQSNCVNICITSFVPRITRVHWLRNIECSYGQQFDKEQ